MTVWLCLCEYHAVDLHLSLLWLAQDFRISLSPQCATHLFLRPPDLRPPDITARVSVLSRGNPFDANTYGFHVCTNVVCIYLCVVYNAPAIDLHLLNPIKTTKIRN